jgi:hypothetical protein
VSSNGAGTRGDAEAAGGTEEDFRRDSDLKDKQL